MQHTGLLHLGTIQPLAGVARNGVFQLQMVAIDRTDLYTEEVWHLIWAGPEAQHFHQQHGTDLTPGTELSVQCTRARTHKLARVGWAILAAVVACEITMKCPPAMRQKLSKKERATSVAA